MKSLKTALTRTKNILENSHIDEFYGIPSSYIVSALQQSRRLLDSMGEVDDFEIQFMQSELKPKIDVLNRILKNIESESDKDENTGKIPDLVHQIIVIIRNTYNIAITGYLRSDEELEKLRQSISVCQNKKEKLDNALKSFSNKWPVVSKNINKIISFHSKIEETFLPDVESAHKKLIEIQEDSLSLEENIKTSCSGIEEELTALSSAREEADSLTMKCSQLEKKVSGLDATYEELVSKCKKQQKEVDDILGDANRASMAGAFKDKAEAAIKRAWWAVGGFVTSAVATTTLGIWFFHQELLSGAAPDYYILPFKVLILFPLIWVTWSQYRAYSENFDLEKGYSHKASTAEAYEGFKRQIDNNDAAMRNELLKLSIEIFGQSPDKYIDKKRPSHPGGELIDNIGKSFLRKRTIPLNSEEESQTAQKES